MDVLIHPKRTVQSYLGIITFPCLSIFCLFPHSHFAFIVIFDLVISYFRESPSFVEILLIAITAIVLRMLLILKTLCKSQQQLIRRKTIY